MSTETTASSKTFRFDISVRELVEFVWRRGDLKAGLDFVSPRRALEGTLGHQKLQSTRPDGYRAEVPLQWDLEASGFQLILRGRIDGVFESVEGLILEEIKTVTGDWTGKASDMHWAQLRLYGGMWNRLHPAEPLCLRLTYYHLDTESEHSFDERSDASELERFLDETLDVYLKWLALHVERCHGRDASLNQLQFPFKRIRDGQQQMLDAVENLVRNGGVLMVEAPTGIGKTMGALFPSIQALASSRVKQVMAVSARTPGQLMFLDSLKLLATSGAHIKSLALSAREKVCRYQGNVCDPMVCQKRIGYFDRLHAARQSALFESTDLLDTAVLQSLGDRFQVCPHALSRDLIPWVDVIVGDYNYAFDPGSQLGMFGEESSRKQSIALLVDESHNLVDRGREMFSQRLDTEDWMTAVSWLRQKDPKAADFLRELWKRLKEVFHPNKTSGQTKPIPSSVEQTELFEVETTVSPALVSEGNIEIERRVHSGQVLLKDIPESWLTLLRHFLDRAEIALKAASSTTIPSDLLDLYFELHQFWKAARESGDCHRLILERKGRHFRLHRYCLDPSSELAKSWKRAWSTLFFSATLTPDFYYRSLLGISDQETILRLDSPFTTSQWSVLVHRGIATTFRQRSYTYPVIAECLLSWMGCRAGNYLVFFPSYDYLQQVALKLDDLLQAQEKESISVFKQEPDMDETARRNFLRTFEKVDEHTRIGLAVMGGIFGEGIDLMGDCLIGVAVVGVGLPQICLERDLIREHFDAEKGNGFDFAYRYPGMNKVMQAVGRLIRSEEDRGVALLIDARFAHQEYRQVLPTHWPVFEISGQQELVIHTSTFWGEKAKISR